MRRIVSLLLVVISVLLCGCGTVDVRGQIYNEAAKLYNSGKYAEAAAKFEEAGDYETPTVINGKKVALTGAGGKMATAKCREKLTELLTLLKADVMEQQTGIVLNQEAWTEGRMILTEEQIASLKAQTDAFLKFIG